MAARRSVLAGMLGALLTLLVVPFAAPAQAAGPAPIVRTDRGAVQGVRAGGVDSFLGIPYAAAPVGARRWTPPQPAPAWSGVKVTDRFGNRCPATESTNGPRSETENCLFVNVQRPAGLVRGDRRPVYVFIHGGGLLNGSSNQADMGPIVARTGVVGVTMNYRLGVFGFLGLPGQAQSGNFGLQDQQAALRWVRRNIAAFGGDPARVTIGGESAGGWSVCTHLVAPGSAGLFARAMMQSGSCPSRTEDAAQAQGADVAQQVGCTTAATVLACLRATPVGRLLDAPAASAVPFPVRGTAFLPQDPRVAVATGHFRHVPVVIGANRDEGRTFAQGDIGWTRAQYEAWVRQNFPADAAAVLARYPWPAHADRFTAAYLAGAVITDSGLAAGIGGCTNRSLTQDLAQYVPTWAYEFDARNGPGLTPIPGYRWGAGHAAELAYLFPSFDNGTPIAATFDAGERRLATEMKRYWGAFVLHGNPAVPGQAAWPRYDTRSVVLSLRPGGRSTTISDATLRAEHQCAFWAAHPTGA